MINKEMNNLSKFLPFTPEAVKTIFNGALGAVTFGAYHQFTTNKIMELNNELIERKHSEQMKEQERKHSEQMKELKDLINKRWFF